MLDASRSDLVAGVAGCGTMGRGIAQVLAQCGVRTLIYDAQAGAAERGLDSIAQALTRLAEKGRLDDPQAIKGRIEVVPGLQALAPCHVVIEAIVEDLAPSSRSWKRSSATIASSRATPRLSRSPPWPRRARPRVGWRATTSSI